MSNRMRTSTGETTGIHAAPQRGPTPDAGRPLGSDVDSSRLLALQRGAGNKATERYLDGQKPHLQRIREENATDKDDWAEKLALFNAFKAKGEGLSTRLDAAVEASRSVDLTAAYQDRYETADKPGTVPNNVEKHLKNPRDYRLVETKAKGQKVAYSNYVSGKEGVLIGGWNYAKEDQGAGRLSNSEILFQQYTAFGGPLATLNKVVRSSIANKESLTIMDLCSGKKIAKRTGVRYAAGTDDFCALLALDNCKGVAFMLTDHARESGGKKITAIEAHLDSLVLHLG